ncbi:PAS domain-containing protein [Porphyrobacter sp. AAP60]|uniref:PAS domain-containing sensor histidine kinase n=1 Tax=Porphyrobacter sp. AAP60 TaxID=1523423 RepID=UPI0006B92041|nr:PAS domain-containing protein [Porphyrobacter sp. AAP60]
MTDFDQDGQHSLLGAAFSALPDAACILEPVGRLGETDRNWRYLAVNPAIQRLLDLGDVIGMTLRERFPRAAEIWSPDLERVLKNGVAEVLVRQGSETGQVLEITLAPLQCGQTSAVMALIRDATGEHRAQEKRRAADARYKLLFDAIDEGFCIIEVLFNNEGQGVDYRFLEANSAFAAHTGLDNAVGHLIRELQPDIEDHWSAVYGRIAMSGAAERFESQSTALGRWFDLFAFPVGEQAPFHVGILFSDVTGRKQMEQTLRHSEKRLQSLIDASSDLLFKINADATLMEQVGGKPLIDDVGEASNWIKRFVHDRDRPKVQRVVDEAIRRREPFEIEHRFLATDGSTGWLHSRAVPVLAEDGKVAEWFGMATDITARRKIEQQLAHGTQMLRVASEMGKVGLWEWNVETGEMTWSAEHYRMEGYAVDEVVPTYDLWVDRVHPEDIVAAEAKVSKAMESGVDYVHEYRVIHPTGEIRWLSARGRFLYDEKGQPVRMLGAMIDTTQRRREEEWQKLLVAELQHRVRNLISMVRSVARLSASSHRNVDNYVDHLIGRLQAMGRTQSTLTRSPGRSVDLAELVREELLVHAARPDQNLVDGPEVALSPHAAEIVTLAIHELATNSIKYGALGDTGYIRITWATEEKEGTKWVHLRWQETSPPSKSKRGRKGFGRKLIEERVPYELQGIGRFEVHDTGVLAQLEFPLIDGPSILETGS